MKSLYVGLILILFTPFDIFADIPTGLRYDSVKLLEDSERKVNLLLKLSNEFDAEDFDSILVYAYEAQVVSKKINFTSGIVRSTVIIAEKYLQLEHYENAMQEMMEGLPFLHQNGDEYEAANYLCLLGEVNRKLSQAEAAIYYFKEANVKYSSIGNLQGVAKSYHLIARIYFEQNELEYSQKYCEKSLKLVNKESNAKLLASNFTLLGEINTKLTKHSEAIPYLEKALKMNDPSENLSEYINNLILLGENYLKINNPTIASEFLNKAFELCEREGLLINQSKAAVLLAKSYELKGDFEQANKYLRVFMNLDSNIISKEELQKTIELNTRFFATVAEHKSKSFSKTNDEYLHLVGKQRNLYIIILVIFILSVITIAFLYRNKERLASENKKLKEKKQKIKVQAGELREANDELIELINFKEKLTGMFVHALKNPLNSIINISSSQSLSKQIKTIKQSSVYMRNVVNDIMDVNMYENKKMVLKRSIFLLEDVIASALEQVEILMLQKNIRFKNSIEETYQLKMDKSIIERVFINLFINAIRYSPQNGEIEIRDEKAGDDVKIFVRDHGPGIPKYKSNDIFDIKGLVSKESEGARSSGMGLAFCKLAIEAHQGKIGFESSPGEGTEFWITLVITSYDEDDEKPRKHLEFSKVEKELIGNSGKAILRPFVYDLNKYNVYEVSQIRNVLKRIDVYDNYQIKAWKSEIDDALFNCNEDKYRELVNLILK